MGVINDWLMFTMRVSSIISNLITAARGKTLEAALSCFIPPYPSADVLVSARAELPRGPLLKRGDTITLICNATVTTTGPAQVRLRWLRWPLPPRKGGPPAAEPPEDAEPTVVATLAHDGVAGAGANGSGEVSVDRLSAVTYRLRVHAAAADDQGLYACDAEAWGQDPHGGWYNTGTGAQSNKVTVYLYARGTCCHDAQS